MRPADLRFVPRTSLALLAIIVLLLRADRPRAAEPPAPIASAFEAFWSASNGKPFETQEAVWDRLIEQPRQQVYDRVVWEKHDRPDWQQVKDQTLRARFAEYPRIARELPAAVDRLQHEVPVENATFRKLFPDAPAMPPIAVVLAPDFDAKTGVLADGQPVLALAIDTLLLERADLSIVFPHELFHLYDAVRSGITNDGVMPGADLTLPLFEEGLATYVSTLVSPGHTDGEYLLQPTLGALPASRLPEIAARFLADADHLAIEPATHSIADGRWFNAGATPYQPDVPNRSGYWLGLNLVRTMTRQHSAREMAAWAPSRAQQETRAALKAMAASPARR